MRRDFTIFHCGGRGGGVLSITTMIMALSTMLLMIMMIQSHQVRAAGLNETKARAIPNKMELLQQKINSIGGKCLLNMQGLDCPGSDRDQQLQTNLLRGLKNNLDNLPIIAGVGYSKMDRSIKPQILVSTAAQRINSEETVTTQMNGATEYYGMLYPKDGSSVFNGLFSHGTSATEMVFSQFFKGDFFAMNSQRQVFTHNVELSTIQVTPEFQQIIDLLPDEMDGAMYNLVISSFGDSIATKVKYGGVVDMTVSIRSCFSDPQMKKYLEAQLQLTINNQDTKSIPNGYARYHKVSSLDIVGGNPQLQDIKKRIESFASNPVPVRMELIPIWRAFPPGRKQEMMKFIYNQYVDSMNREISNKVSDLEAKKLADKLKAQPVHAFKTDNTKDAFVSRFGSEIQVSTDSPAEIPETIQAIETRILPFPQHIRIPVEYLKMTPVVHRNKDGTFYFDFKYGNCDYKNPNNCRYPGQLRFPELKVTSPVGKDTCIKVRLIEREFVHYPILDFIVCSGCMPVISSNFKDVTCQCPFVN